MVVVVVVVRVIRVIKVIKVIRVMDMDMGRRWGMVRVRVRVTDKATGGAITAIDLVTTAASGSSQRWKGSGRNGWSWTWTRMEAGVDGRRILTRTISRTLSTISRTLSISTINNSSTAVLPAVPRQLPLSVACPSVPGPRARRTCRTGWTVRCGGALVSGRRVWLRVVVVVGEGLG